MTSWVILVYVIGMLVAMYIEYRRRLWLTSRRSAPRRPPIQGGQPRGGAGNSGAAPVRIAPALKAELDQTPRWWEDAFHQLLEISDAPVVLGEKWEQHTWGGEAVFVYQERGYPECTCPNCRRICK